MKNEEKYKTALRNMARDFCTMSQNFCDECDIGKAYEKEHGLGTCYSVCEELYIKYYLESSEAVK